MAQSTIKRNLAKDPYTKLELKIRNQKMQYIADHYKENGDWMALVEDMVDEFEAGGSLTNLFRGIKEYMEDR
tara:strand:- start:656 stop:871 length:216 start_codon:yes stop_codon:yes gene_type:complete